MKSDLLNDNDDENVFLVNFYKKHFSGTDIPIYSKQVLYKLIEEINIIENRSGVENGSQG